MQADSEKHAFEDCREYLPGALVNWRFIYFSDEIAAGREPRWTEDERLSYHAERKAFEDRMKERQAEFVRFLAGRAIR